MGFTCRAIQRLQNGINGLPKWQLTFGSSVFNANLEELTRDTVMALMNQVAYYMV